MGIFSFLSGGDTVYFPGCTNYFKYRENYTLYKRIFDSLGINFKELDVKLCCGVNALEAGYENEARKLARRNVDLFNEKGIKKIITTSPSAFKMFSLDYPKLIPDWNIKVENIWKLILDKIKDKNLIKVDEIVSYHDSCYLGRYLGIYDEPRMILMELGYKIREFPNSRENSICCGSCGGLPRVNIELANSIAKDRILEAKRIGVKKIIVIGFENYSLLKKNSEGLDMEIVEFSNVLAKALDIIIESEDIEVKSEELKEDLKESKELEIENG